VKNGVGFKRFKKFRGFREVQGFRRVQEVQGFRSPVRYTPLL
jgi:hypothetical protein